MQPLTPNLWINSSELFTYHSGIFVSEGIAAVIDPGLEQSEIDALVQFVRAQNWQVDAVILTHAHWDHILGAEAFPNARIFAQRVYLTASHDDAARIARHIEKTTDLGRTAPFVIPMPHETFDSGMQIQIGALTLELAHTPGHAPDHLFVYERASGTVWTADMLTDEEIPYVMDNLVAYERTMQKIRADDFQFLIPCHGAPTNDANEIRARIENDRAYISELRERVQSAVSAGKSLDETKVLCLDIPYRQSVENNRGAHRRNVESAYVELGGQVSEPVGW
jgi:glyoxylase-like metal-dependent hydrolase (beta-lactamase superfamily II)